MVTYPSDWKTDKIGNVVENFDNLRIPVTKNQRVPGNTPYYGANGVQDFVSGFTHDGEFVLVAEDGANDLLNYPVSYVSGRVWVNNHAHVLAGIKSELNTKFLSYLLKKVDYTAILVGGTRAKLNGKTLKGIDITYPNKISEQQAIATILSNFDEYIDNLTELLKKKKAIRDGVLEELLDNRKSLKGFNSEWVEIKLECITDNIFDIDHYMPESTVSGVPYVMTSDLENFSSKIDFGKCKHVSRYDYEILSKKGKCEKHDLIFARYATIGTVCYIDTDRDFLVSYSCLTIKINKNVCFPKYLYYYFQSNSFKLCVNELIRGNTQKNLGKELLNETIISLPLLLDEQQAIAQVLTAIDEEIESLETEKSKIIQIREGAMDDLLTGRVRLKV